MAARRTSTGSSKTGSSKTGSRKAKPAPDLMQVALTKLNQRDQTKAQLRQLLVRKATAQRKAGADRAGDAESPGDSWQEDATDRARIDEVLGRLESSGIIDDKRFAEHFVRGARSRGASAQKVQQKLGQRGVARDGIDQALETLAAEGQDDLAAAIRYAKRRRLAERYDLRDPKERQKALASLARQGFSITTALRALGQSGSSEPDDS